MLLFGVFLVLLVRPHHVHIRSHCPDAYCRCAESATDPTSLPRGLGQRLARESDKLKKVYRDKQRYLKQRAAELERLARQAADSDEYDDDDDLTDAGQYRPSACHQKSWADFGSKIPVYLFEHCSSDYCQ